MPRSTGKVRHGRYLAEGGIAAPPEKNTPEWHAYQIAKHTLEMPEAMVGVMGGPSKEEAKATLEKYGAKFAEGGIVEPIDWEWVYKHAYDWAELHRSADYEPGEYAEAFVKQGQEEGIEDYSDFVSHPAFERVWLAYREERHIEPMAEGGVAHSHRSSVAEDSFAVADTLAKAQHLEDEHKLHKADLILRLENGYNLTQIHNAEHGEGDTGTEMQEGAALVENEGPGVSAIVGEEGPEAVIPLDDPQAVEVMAEAIEEGGGGEIQEADGLDAAEAVAEAAEEVAEAATEVAEASAQVADDSAEIVSELTDTLEHLADFAEFAEEAEHVEEMEEHAEHIAEAEEAREEEAPSAEVAEAPKRDAAPRKRHWSQVTLGELFGSSKR
jgi:hypothetical protein